MTTTTRSGRVPMVVAGILAFVMVIVVAVTLGATGVFASPTNPVPTVSATSTPTPSATPEEKEWEATIDNCIALAEERSALDIPQAFSWFTTQNASKFEDCRQLRLAECRPIAAMAYMEYQLFDFSKGEYVIGEANIDHQAAAKVEVGPSAFRDRSGAIPTTRAQLAEAFESHYEGNLAMMDRLRAAYPSLSDRELFDPSLWEIVQITVATEMSGNTGYSFLTQRVVNYGSAFQAQPGETFWLPIDPATCVVRPMEVQPGNADPDNPAVGVIRAACLNGGTGLNPKDPTKDPWQRGNAPIYGGPNVNPGLDEFIAPGGMEQPGVNPRVDPAAPTPTATPAPVVTPTTGPQPTVTPSTQPTNNGELKDGGPGCNPEFQNC